MHKRVLRKTEKESASPKDLTSHFGQALQQERISQGLSIADIQKKTGVSAKYLVSMEEGERRELPADAFNRGFIRLYAEALGLDPTSSLASYEKQWGFSNGMRGAESFLGGEHMAESKSPLADRQVLSFLSIVLIVASGFLAYKIFFSQYDLKTVLSAPPTKTKSEKVEHLTKISPQNIPIEIQQTVVSKPLPPPIQLEKEESIKEEHSAENKQEIEILPPPSSATLLSDEPVPEELRQNQEEVKSATLPPPPLGDGQPLKEASSDPYVLHAIFTELTWLRIRLDDQEPSEYTFKPNEKHTWQASKNIILFLGNAGGVHLTLNDTPIVIDKKSGQTHKLTIP